MDRQTRLSVIASIRSYRSMCILLQEYSNRNLIHPIALQQLTDFLYAIPTLCCMILEVVKPC